MLVRLPWILSILAVPAFAQVVGDPPSVDSASLNRLIESVIVPIHTAPADPVGGEYGLWAGASNYKVSFGAGIEFVPRRADDEFAASLGWRTESVRVGGREQVDRPGRARWSERRYELDYGGVVEAYDVRRTGVEQSFVIERRPAPGPITVTGRIATGLVCESRTVAHQALEFRVGDEVAVRYGSALVFDAVGRTSDVTTEVDGDRIRLRVAAEFVESATFPVTIDPLFSATGVLGPDSYGSVTITASGGFSPSLLIGYTLPGGGLGDRDAFVLETEFDYSAPSLVFTDITDSWSTGAVETSFAGGSSSWAIALERFFSLTIGRRVRAYVHPLDVAGANNGTLLFVPTPAGDEDLAPSVGGSRTSSRALIAFQRRAIGGIDPSILGIQVDTTAATLAPVFTIRDPFFDRLGRPSVSRSAFSNEDWVVASSSTVSLFGERIYVARVDQFGGLVASEALKDISPAEELITLAVAGARDRFALAYKVHETATGDELTRMIRFDWQDGQSAPTTIRERTTLRETPPPLIRGTAISRLAFDHSTQSHWILGVADSLIRLGQTCAITEQVSVVGRPRTTYSGATFRTSFPFVLPTSGGIVGNRLVHSNDAAVVAYGTSCAPQGTGWGFSQPVAGNQTYRVSLHGVTGNTSAVHLLGFAPSHIDLGLIGITGCFLEVDPSVVIPLSTVTSATGSATVTIPLPDDPLFASDLFGQWIYIDPAITPVPLRTHFGLRHQIR